MIIFWRLTRCRKESIEIETVIQTIIFYISKVFSPRQKMAYSATKLLMSPNPTTLYVSGGIELTNNSIHIIHNEKDISLLKLSPSVE